MKKRFLSAVLALAMMLTLLPVSVFAAATDQEPESKVTSVTLKPDGTVTWSYTPTGEKSSKTAEVKLDKGLIAGVRSSSTGNVTGKWYANVDDLPASTSSVTLLGGGLSIDVSKQTGTTFTVDLNGKAVTLTGLDNVKKADTTIKVNKLVVKDTFWTKDDTPATVTVTGDISYTDRAFTLEATNAKINGSVTVKNAAGAVTLNNAEVGEIEVSGNASGKGTVTLNNNSVATKVTLGELTTDSSNKTVSSTQKLTLTGKSSVSGAVAIEGNSSTISVTDSKLENTVALSGTSTSLSVAGWYSEVGAVTLLGSKNAKVTSGTGPKVTITGGTVASIEADTTNEQLSAPNYNISVTGGTVEGGITLPNATIKVDGATSGKITQGTGSLTISGGASVTGDGVEWGSTTSAGSINLTIEGSKTTVAKIAQAGSGTGNKVTMGTVKISGGTMGEIDLGGYTGRGITGGTFGGSLLYESGKESQKNKYLSANMQYEISDGTNYTYISGTNVNDVFQAVVDKYDTTTTVHPVKTKNKDGDTETTFKFKADDTNKVVVITAAEGDLLLLPTMVSGRPVAVWYEDGNETKTHSESYVVPASVSAATLVASVTTRDEFITSVSIDETSEIKGVSVTLSGDTIKLTNAVNLGVIDEAEIILNVKTGSKPDGCKVKVTYYSSYNGRIEIISVDNSVFTYSGNKLILNDKTYIIDGSGLKAMAASVEAAGIETGDKATVKANTSRLSSLTTVDRETLKEALEKDTTVDFSKSPAVLEAVTRQMGGISQSTANSYIAAAKKDMATKYKNAEGTKNDKIDDAYIAAHGGGFDTVTVRAYLYIDVTNYKPFGSETVGSMTANLTPYYEIVVTGGEDWKGEAAEYTAKSGASLGTLSGEPGEVEISIAVPDNFAKASAAIWVHHGDSVYANDGNADLTWIDTWPASGSAEGEGGGGDPAPAKDTIDIEFTTLDGFSPFTFDGTEPAVAVQNLKADKTADTVLYFDSLQTAINKVKEGGLVTVGPDYTGTKALTVSGVARTFYVDCGSNKALRLTFAGADANQKGTYDNYYTVTLEKDTAAPGENIVVASVTGGSARVSANPAKQGDTVTVTLSAASGYVADGVSVKTASGTTVSVSGSGSSYTFTMPAGTVTVTPSFKASSTDNRATVSVAAVSGGSAVTSASATGNKAAQGSTVTVTTVPSNGYRSMGITARTNTGATASYTRTGANTWNVTVPSGATTVTVTPNFDIDNGTPFTDVRSTHWASKYVAWAYRNDYIDGTSTYTYSPSNYMTLGEVVAMLYKAAGEPSVAGMNNPFTNLAPGSHWAYDAFIWAANQGLISGGTINPWGYATRAEIVQILYRRAGSPTVYGTSGFADVASNAAYSKAVTWARQKGLTNGYGGNTNFAPGYAVSRAEMSAFLGRAFGNMA